MSWLNELTVCIYRHPETSEEIYWEGPWEERPQEIEGHLYAGFAPRKTGMVVRSMFERNGRVAYEYNLGNGKKFIRSATRERYEHNLGNLSAEKRKEKGNQIADSVYSRSFEKALKDAKAKKEN